jgi:uncharacterized protein (DUF433 family)
MGQVIDIYGGKDPQKLPLYGTTDVARMLLVPRSTVRTWAFRVRGKSGRYRNPVIDAVDRKKGLLSFENLVELHVLSSLRRVHGVSLPEIRKAVRYLQTEFETKHPLSSEQMYTDGVNLFVERLGQLIGANQEGQQALSEVIRPYLDRVERDREKLLRLYPVTEVRSGVPDLDSPKTIGIDPRMRFGRPYLVQCGIETEVFADRWRAGETIDDMVKDFQIPREAVEEALRYEALGHAA